MQEGGMKYRSVIFWTASKLTNIVLLVSLTVCLATNAAKAVKSDSDPSPDDLYHQAWEIIKDNYVDGTFNGQKWESWEHHYSGKLKTEEDAYLAIETMVASLGDTHIGLVPTNQVKTHLFEASTAQTQSVDNKAVRETSDVVSAKVSSEPGMPKLGYIRIKAFKSHTCAQDIRRAISDLQACDGLLLDLRDNKEGLLGVALECVAFFHPRVPTNLPIYFTIDRSGYKNIQMSLSNAIFRKPIVLLTNRDTADTAVMFAAALKENNRASVVGTNTARGPLVVDAIYVLGDGTKMKLAAAYLFSPAGHNFSAVGLEPNEEVKLTATQKRSGKGAWWKSSATDAKFSDASTSQDLQLLKAEKVLNDAIKKSPGPIPSLPDKGGELKAPIIKI
jgi:C-terminal processing protease CtpA/Prc